MKLEIAQLSDVGCVRQQNEDSTWVDPEQGLFILADGMGGHNAGEVASHLACQFISEQLLQDKIPQRRTRVALEKAVQAAHQAIRHEAEENPDYEGMGTTVVALWLRGKSAYWAHVGDSRIYRFRNDRLKQLTEDQSLVNEYVQQGLLSPEEARTAPMRSVILQAVGTKGDITVETGRQPWKPGDVLLACSDGLSDFVTPDQLEQILSSATSLEEAASNAVECVKLLGAPDNVTVILVRPT